MKAIVVREFGPPEVMKLENTATPVLTAAGILVRVYAVGINPVDTYLRSGDHAHAPKLPYTPGKDAAGVVEAVGGDVKEFNVGDRVYIANSLSGTYAEFALCEEHWLGRLPDNISFEQGAGIWTPYATSYRGLFQKAKARMGETVLVHGASGGVGIAAVQWAKNAGLTIIGTASSDKGKKLVLEQGADHVFDHSSPDYLAEIKEITGSKGVDIILEMLANVNLRKDFEILAMFGRITVIGNRGSLEFNPRAAMGKDASIFGMSLFNTPQAEIAEIHKAIYNGLSVGFISPFISKSLPLGDAARAHHDVMENKALGKIVLTTTV